MRIPVSQFRWHDTPLVFFRQQRTSSVAFGLGWESTSTDVEKGSALLVLLSQQHPLSGGYKSRLMVSFFVRIYGTGLYGIRKGRWSLVIYHIKPLDISHV